MQWYSAFENSAGLACVGQETAAEAGRQGHGCRPPPRRGPPAKRDKSNEGRPRVGHMRYNKKREGGTRCVEAVQLRGEAGRERWAQGGVLLRRQRGRLVISAGIKLLLATCGVHAGKRGRGAGTPAVGLPQRLVSLLLKYRGERGERGGVGRNPLGRRGSGSARAGREGKARAASLARRRLAAAGAIAAAGAGGLNGGDEAVEAQ